MFKRNLGIRLESIDDEIYIVNETHFACNLSAKLTAVRGMCPITASNLLDNEIDFIASCPEF